jgi:23S rRNA (adenine2503-C2)-methyltransferase
VPGPFDLSAGALDRLLEGEPAYRSRQIRDGLYDHGRWPHELTNLPKALRERLAGEPALAPALRPVVESVGDGGETRKWLWELEGGARVETVLMHYADRTTVCVSTQAGCAMACQFCATGQAGFERQLSAGEIVEQVVRARRAAAEHGWRLSNVVFMGMGEPLANYDRVWAAVERLHDDIGLSARHLTISTVGIIPGIRRLATEAIPVNLAVSLHAANDELRNRLVPINTRYPLAELMAACRSYLEAKGRRLSFEWALIDGVNDRPADAGQLARLARPLGAHVNLIPLNPTPGYPAVGAPAERVRDFRDRLVALGVNATIRRNRGTSIDAACGQLRAAHEITPGKVPVAMAGRKSAPLPD